MHGSCSGWAVGGAMEGGGMALSHSRDDVRDDVRDDLAAIRDPSPRNQSPGVHTVPEMDNEVAALLAQVSDLNQSANQSTS